MNMRHEDGRPFKVGDQLKKIEGTLACGKFYEVTATAVRPTGSTDIGFLTSAPVSPNKVMIRKFNGDVVWWCDPPETPTGLHLAMETILALLNGSAMQTTIEVVVTDCATRRKILKYFTHVTRDLSSIDEVLYQRLADVINGEA